MIRTTKMENGYLCISAGKADILDAGTVIKKLSLKAPKAPFFGQILAIEPVWSENTLAFAALQAILALREKQAFSDKPTFEFLIRLSGQRQLSKALVAFGVRNGARDIGIIVFGSSAAEAKKQVTELAKLVRLKPSVRAFSKTKQQQTKILEYYGIIQAELDALSDLPRSTAIEQLICERIALVALEK